MGGHPDTPTVVLLKRCDVVETRVEVADCERAIRLVLAIPERMAVREWHRRQMDIMREEGRRKDATLTSTFTGDE